MVVKVCSLTIDIQTTKGFALLLRFECTINYCLFWGDGGRLFWTRINFYFYYILSKLQICINYILQISEVARYIFFSKRCILSIYFGINFKVRTYILIIFFVNIIIKTRIDSRRWQRLFVIFSTVKVNYHITI